jgi:predicted metal-dependent enzyme (double-stranded beta helix superfamily)
MFDLDELVADCRACLAEDDVRPALREVLERTVSEPTALAEALQPDRAGITLLHCTDDLTIIHVVWAPGMRLIPHDHRMWAAIAVYNGREDNEFFRRPEQGDRGLVPSNGTTINSGEVTMLGAETIHAVANPDRVPTAAIHVYGGDFVNQPRSQWRPPDLDEEPYDAEVIGKIFEEANASWGR